MASGNVQVKITVKTTAYRRWMRQKALVIAGWARAIVNQN